MLCRICIIQIQLRKTMLQVCILEKVRLPPRQLELVVIQIRNTYVRAYHMYVPDLWQIYYEHLYLVDHEPGTVICHDM